MSLKQQASAVITQHIFPPVLSMSFDQASINIGDTAVLTFTVSNPNPLTNLSDGALLDIAFSCALPVGLTVASGSQAECSGLLNTITPSTVSFSGGMLLAGQSCVVTVTVTGTTSGLKNVNSSEVQANGGGFGNSTSTSITVNAPIALVGSGAFGGLVVSI